MSTCPRKAGSSSATTSRWKAALAASTPPAATGVDDFNVCQKYPQIPITVPVDDGGYLTEQAGKYAGQRVWASNKTILADLTAAGAVMGQLHIKHQYPHCWRCHNPIIFRATEQWFCSIAKFREDVYKAIDTVTWMPDWGHDRMHGMVRDRNDWCISRQRTWGVLSRLYCKKCGAYHITDATIKAVSDLFRKEAPTLVQVVTLSRSSPLVKSARSAALPEWTKDTDIMDVWFDSGSTHAAVLEERPELRFPARSVYGGRRPVPRLVPVQPADQCGQQGLRTL